LQSIVERAYMRAESSELGLDTYVAPGPVGER
jgi:hypothetical protein